MDAINNGGPAFPHTDSGDTAARPGMTLRDYFAAKAMQSLILTPPGTIGRTGEDRGDAVARCAYGYSDAMLAAERGNAAAPELLEALQEVFEQCDGYVPNTSKATWAKARAAIAKATGEQP